MSQNEKNAHKPTREAHAINNKVLWLWESKAVCTSQQRQLSSVEWWKVTLRIFLASHVISIFDWICLIVCKVSGSTTFNRTIYCRPVVESSNRKDLSSRWVCVRIIPGKRSFACNARICIVIDFYLLLTFICYYYWESSISPATITDFPEFGCNSTLWSGVLDVDQKMME